VEYGGSSSGSRHRHIEALKDLTMSVEEGEIFGRWVQTARARQPRIKILMGIHFATKGGRKLMGRPLGDLEVKKRIGFLPENPYFYDYLKGPWEFLNLLRPALRYVGTAAADTDRGAPGGGGLVRHCRQPAVEEVTSKGMNQRIGLWLRRFFSTDPQLVNLGRGRSRPWTPGAQGGPRHHTEAQGGRPHRHWFSSHILSDAEMILRPGVGFLFRASLSTSGP